ncbi:probable purine permease 10 [Humulus lupulus]|uniref:probable purine permease 10 n=1 Tax=Humulus lupulus TaxID=3486 RepID=UPI002B4091BC|nr:probable purine permease 10 [Humulus lupulus]
MEKDDHLKFKIMAKEANSIGSTSNNEYESIPSSRGRDYFQWLRVIFYAFLLISGQAAAMLLGRLYFAKGGNSNWMATLVQLAGFPILLPYYCFAGRKSEIISTFSSSSPTSSLVLVLVCVFLGIVLVADCFLYSIGLSYLPISTYSLISASQLAFNAFFSFFLNSQKFTPFIVNSLVLLTISSVLLIFNVDPEEGAHGVSSKGKYVIGFICTVAASAVYGLLLSLTQFVIKKVLKRETFSIVMNITILESLLATSVSLLGLFASSEWKNLGNEMYAFRLGKVSYVMTLVGTAISWQAFFIGTIGLILEVSSLFSNAISVLGLPMVPILAVFFFNEKMYGVKVISLVLAIWGFISYVYQDYVDSYNSKAPSENANGEIRASQEEYSNIA